MVPNLNEMNSKVTPITKDSMWVPKPQDANERLDI
jgi:hypothetical protein